MTRFFTFSTLTIIKLNCKVFIKIKSISTCILNLCNVLTVSIVQLRIPCLNFVRGFQAELINLNIITCLLFKYFYIFTGRRLCAGETYARQTMFQVFAAFMQAFTVSTADGKPLLKPAKRIQGIITTIPEFWVRITPRT